MPLGRSSNTYSPPDRHASLDELATPAPVQSPEDRNLDNHELLEEGHDDDPNRQLEENVTHHADRSYNEQYEVPSDYTSVNEIAAPSPVANRREEHQFWREYLEETHTQDQSNEARQHRGHRSIADPDRRRLEGDESRSLETKAVFSHRKRTSKLATELYTVSYLVLFSIMGTLARLGLQALTTYVGNPVTFSELWANVGGSFIMGFLSEDTKLFKEGFGSDKEESEGEKRDDDKGNGVADQASSQNGLRNPLDAEATRTKAKTTHTVMKKAIPLYIGLTTGFCGSFTSFSSFIRDAFLALSNELPIVQSSNGSATSDPPRNNGYSFMALAAVIILTICLCLSALQGGAHLAIALERFTPTLPASMMSKIFDRFAVAIAWGLWLGSICMAIWPPDRPFGPAGHESTSWLQETWRGQVLVALVFAPLGCILRFYASLHLNPILAAFPLGTFIVNVSGTVLLGVFWDLQHAPLHSIGDNIGGEQLGCQVLQGIQDGFCGCLTTVSTWVLELTGLRRNHAYLYGTTSTGVGLAFLVVIMGSLVWSHGISEPVCLQP